MTPRMKKASEAWGKVPEWVIAIVDACDAPNGSQNKVARKLGYSGAVISQVIVKRYLGDMTAVEQQARMHLMKSTVVCPALGEITEIACLGWREEANELRSSSPTRVRMFTACRNCPRFYGEKSR